MYKYLQISLVKRLFDFKQKREFCRKPAERDGITGVSFRRPAARAAFLSGNRNAGPNSRDRHF